MQGICPDGWHLPDNDEWNELFTAVGGIATAGKVLKSQTGWKNNGSDDFGFSALPIAEDYDDGSRTAFWSATEIDMDDSYLVSMDYGKDQVEITNLAKSNQHPVRCIKD